MDWEIIGRGRKGKGKGIKDWGLGIRKIRGLGEIVPHRPAKASGRLAAAR